MKFHAILFLFAAVAIPVFAEPPAPPAPRHSRGKFASAGGERNFQRHSGIWRVFSMLPQAEQKELMKLQRSDPDKFRTVMQEKSAKLHAEMQAKRNKVYELAAKIRNTADEKEKTALRDELRAILKKSFDSRIAHLKRNIENNKKRIEKMEAELKKRESNADAIIDAMTDSVISGKKTEGKRPRGMHRTQKPPRPR